MASEVKEESNSTPDIKNDEDITDETSKNADNSIKEDAKDSVKNESKEESGKEGSEDDDDDDDDDEEVALLDRPVEVTGCRARKKVERLEVSFSIPKEKQEFQEGKGTKLGECPRIEAQMQKIKVADLKPLHKILFNRIGSVNEIKKNIRKFSGFPFEENSTEYSRKKTSVLKMTTPVLKSVCLVLDIERGGTKEDIVNRILSFLMKPEDSGKKVPSKKKTSKDKKKSTGKQEKKKGKSEKKTKSEKNGSDDELEENNEDDDSTGGEASMGGTDEDVEDEAEASDEEPKKKSKETKASKAKSKADKGKKEEKKTKATKRKIDEDSSDNSENEKPAKKAKMPSDDEISKLVKQILESADLQEITMKKVIKQVSDAYPDFDLSHKKAFIKSTIKSVIS